MTLRLPEPLPYDFVDEMIDESTDFTSYCRLEDNRTVWYANPHDYDWGNFVRALVEFNDDLEVYEDDDLIEDEEGYVDGHELRWGMFWCANEWTEEDLNDWTHRARALNPRDLPLYRSKINA